MHYIPANSRRFMPATHCLLTSKTENKYARLFELMKEKVAGMGIDTIWDMGDIYG
jgi:hypothetical protein